MQHLVDRRPVVALQLEVDGRREVGRVLLVEVRRQHPPVGGADGFAELVVGVGDGAGGDRQRRLLARRHARQRRDAHDKAALGVRRVGQVRVLVHVHPHDHARGADGGQQHVGTFGRGVELDRAGRLVGLWANELALHHPPAG